MARGLLLLRVVLFDVISYSRGSNPRCAAWAVASSNTLHLVFRRSTATAIINSRRCVCVLKFSVVQFYVKVLSEYQCFRRESLWVDSLDLHYSPSPSSSVVNVLNSSVHRQSSCIAPFSEARWVWS